MKTMRKTKSYNRIPSFKADFAIYAAVGVAATVVAAPLLYGQLQALMATLPMARGASLPTPEAFTAALVASALLIALAMASSSQRRFHDGAWAGERPSANRACGSARIVSRPSALKHEFKAWRKESEAEPGLVVGGVGRQRGILLVDGITHALVLGGTGSGKTTSCLLPSMVNLIQAGASAVVLDPKGECFDVTGAYAQEHGYKVVCIDFSSAATSDGWLPLQPAIDCARGEAGRDPSELAGEVRVLADTLIPERRESSPIWTQAARILFSGLAAFVAESARVPDGCRNLSTVAALAAMEQDELIAIVEKLPANSAARLSLDAVANAPAETYGGFRVNLNTLLNVYADPSVSPMLACPGFRAEDFLDGKVMLYVRFNSSTQAYDALVSALVSQLMDNLRRLAENRCDGALPNPVYWLLEEFGQLPKIPGMQKHLSIIRSLGMHAVVVAQARGQIEAVYREDAEAIFNNIDTTLFLAANDVKTCRYYSDLLGTYTVETKTYSQTKGANSGSSGKSTSYREARLMRPEELAKWNWEAGHLVIKKGQAYACSSLPVSATFAGDALGLGGKEPDAGKRREMRPPRPAKNFEAAKAWRPSGGLGDDAAGEIAAAIDAAADPRFS